MNDTARTESIGKLLIWLAAPTVWATHFLVMYAAETLICTAGSSGGRYFIPVAVVATAVAVASLLYLMTRRLVWIRPNDPTAGDGSLFLQATSIALSAVSMLAVLWVALPALLLPACRT
jgi:hypothetical protein